MDACFLEVAQRQLVSIHITFALLSDCSIRVSQYTSVSHVYLILSVLSNHEKVLTMLLSLSAYQFSISSLPCT